MRAQNSEYQRVGNKAINPDFIDARRSNYAPAKHVSVLPLTLRQRSLCLFFQSILGKQTIKPCANTFSPAAEELYVRPGRPRLCPLAAAVAK